jgi:hypothetical protein
MLMPVNSLVSLSRNNFLRCAVSHARDSIKARDNRRDGDLKPVATNPVEHSECLDARTIALLRPIHGWPRIFQPQLAVPSERGLPSGTQNVCARRVMAALGIVSCSDSLGTYQDGERRDGRHRPFSSPSVLPGAPAPRPDWLAEAKTVALS